MDTDVAWAEERNQRSEFQPRELSCFALLCTRVELLRSIVHTRGEARSSRLHCFLNAQRIWVRPGNEFLLFPFGLLVKVRVHVTSRVMKNECAKREKWRSN